MTQEEKAKAYDEAIKKMKSKLKDFKEIIIDRSDIEEIFPELAESEDERIKKVVKDFVENYLFWEKNNLTKEKALAWLEKQGEQKPIMNVPSREVILSIWDLGNEWKELTNGSISTEYGTQLEYIQKHWQESEYYLRAKKSEQKPADKVEPKFKVGDWVVLYPSEIEVNRKVVQISRVERCQLNMYWTTEGTWFGDGTDARLWTIQDAKEGNILVNWNNTIFIFKDIADETVKFHIAYNEKWNIIKTPLNKFSHLGLPEPQFEFHPATKEQRDLLFQKMKEAGYEWNKQEKRLIKVPKTKKETGVLKQLIDEGNPAWGEEDDYTLNETIQHLEELIRIDKAKHCSVDVQYYQRDIDWLKSLKDRVQPKQEWNEKDKEMFNTALDMIEWYGGKNENKSRLVSNWLKSLKPQNTWKPSDEQLNNILDVLSFDNCTPKRRELLESLYNDLKKLREK